MALRATTQSKVWHAVCLLLTGGWMVCVVAASRHTLFGGQMLRRLCLWPALHPRLSLGLCLAALGLVSCWRFRPHWVTRLFIATAALAPLLLSWPSRQTGAGLAVIYLSALAWLLGGALLRLLRCVVDDAREQAVLALVNGWGLIALLTLAAGLAGCLTRMTLVFSGGLLGGLAWFYARQDLRRQLAAAHQAFWWDWLALLCGGILLLLFVHNVAQALAPEITFDALKSHLALAKIYARQQSVTGLVYSIGSFWPLGGDLLLTAAYVLGGESAARLTHLGAGVLAAALVYLLGRRLHTPATGLLAATIFYSTPIIAWEAGTAYIDLFQVMYISAAWLALLLWLAMQRPRYLVLLGCYLGYALGVKPTTGYLALGTGLVLLAYAGWRGRPALKNNLTGLVLLTLATSLLGGVWYWRAYWLTGNPVFPFLNHIFRSPLWTPTDESFNFSTYGMGAQPAALLKWLWRITFQTARFGENADGSLGVFYLALLPLSPFFVKPRRALAMLLAVTFFFLLVSFFSVQYLRYLLPGLPLLAVLAGWTATVMQQCLAARGRGWAALGQTVWLGGFVLTGHLLVTQFAAVPGLLPLDVLAGRVTRAQYVAAAVPGYEAYAYANRQLPPHARLYGVNTFYQYLSDFPLLTPHFSRVGNQIFLSTSEEELLGLLEREGIEYLLIDEAILPANWNYLVHRRDFLARHATELFSAHGTHLYRLRKAPP